MAGWPPTHFLRLTLCDHFLPSISLSVCSFYLFGHISIWSKFTYNLFWSKKVNKKRKKQKVTKRGKMGKNPSITTSHIWILRVLFDHDLVLFWTPIPLSTFHQHYSVKYSKSSGESSPFFQSKCPVWMGVTVLRHNACDYHMTRC